MNKRITSIVLCFVMVLSMLTTAATAYAADSVALKVTSDATRANPGDTIDFAVSIGAVENLAILEFQLKIPSGLTIIEDSVALPEDLEITLDSDGAIVKPWSGSNWFWRYSAGSKGYSGTTDLVLVTFTCKVNDDSTFENKTVTVEVESFADLDFGEITPTITSKTVVVEKKPVPVTGVSVADLSLNVGETKTLSWSVTPENATNKDVTFLVNEPEVIELNQTTGEVKGLEKGTATVTVTTVDGSFHDTCTVTVSCAHANKIETPAKPSTCTAQGNNQYFTCNDCGAVLKADGTETNVADETLPLASHVAGEDDGDCTTAVKCANCEQIATPAKTAHEAGEDDGDCTTAVKCANCEQIATPAKDAHVAEADDGDCTTAVKCQYCDEIMTAAKTEHVAAADDGDCTTAVKCQNCDEIMTAAKDKHVAAADDGDCTTAVKCQYCDAIVTAAKDEHVAAADDGDCTTAVKCQYCDEIMTAAKAEHVAETDDGDCTTAVKCQYCDAIVTAAKDEHVAETDDGDCTTAVKCQHCDAIVTAAKAAHVAGEDDGNCATAVKCVNCEKDAVAAKQHAWDTKWTAGDATHWYACTNEGCTAKNGEESHDGTPECGKKAHCSICNADYGVEGGHNFAIRTVNADTLATPATCIAKATYYYSCSCGAINKEGETFEDGDFAKHVFATEWSKDSAEHWHACTTEGCTEKDQKATHTFDQSVVSADALKSAANCKNAAVYFKSCVCGQISTTEFFTSGEPVADAHIWDEGKVTKEPTTEAEGEKTFTCTVDGCGVTKTEPIAKLDNKPVITPVGPKPQQPTQPEEPEVTPSFGDVAGEWFEADVEYVAEKGLMNGVGDGSMFAPLMNTSRGMIVTILWRMEGQPVPMTANTFKDVEKGAYYEQAVAWASENGIVNGYGATFGPNDNITREQFATILFRYAQYKGLAAVTLEENLIGYADHAKVSPYAVQAMNWAVGKGLINGIGSELQPAGAASRAQAAAILHRFCENVIQ